MPEAENILRCDHLLLNQALKTVEFQGRSISLSPTSFDLLSQLMQQAPAVVSVDELLEKVWDRKVVNRETVKQQIKSLRDQLGDAASMVESVRGFGYQIKSQQTSRENQGLGSGFVFNTKKNWLISISVLVLVSLAWYANYSAQNKFSLPLKTAILPFKLLDSNDEDLVFLLQDELTDMMSRQDDVKAISVSALEHAKYKNYSLKEYADLLEVDVLFEGSIQELITGYQVNVRMVWTKSSIAVWRDKISIEGKDRNRLIEKTKGELKNFIQKKVAYIQKRAS